MTGISNVVGSAADAETEGRWASIHPQCEVRIEITALPPKVRRDGRRAAR